MTPQNPPPYDLAVDDDAISDLLNYPRPSVAVDVVIFSLTADRTDLCVLLLRRDRPPFHNTWALPGGIVDVAQSLEEAAVQQLERKTGVRNVYIEQLYTFGEVGRDPRGRVITVSYFALVPYTVIETTAADGALRWHSVAALPALAFDHARIIETAVQRLRYKLEYSAVGFELLPDEFTLSELQQAYEMVLGEVLDKRNFRRKILAAEIIEDTGRLQKESEGRPARLYRYIKGATAEIKTRRLFP